LPKRTRVFGLERRTTLGRPISESSPPYTPVSGDLLDDYSLLSLIEQIRPSVVYNFAAQSYIPASWHQPPWAVGQSADIEFA
jgi:GDPmannose 4,6-dehydratase